MRQIKFSVIFLLSVFYSLAQSGKVVGKVTDSKAEGLPFVVILAEPGKKVVLTDFEGNYSIDLAEGKYSLTFQLNSFRTKKIEDVIVSKNETTPLAVSLENNDNVLDSVVVTAKAKDESVAAQLIQQKNNAAVSDGIGGQQIKNQPTVNTSDVLRKVSGASIQDNKFAIIRGLNDRYNGAFLNGAPLPSSESDRKAFAFDIFPSNMLDNLSINKTATPDMPAEFAGGLIFITTKNIPDKNFQSFNIGGGYNTVTTGKDRIGYQGGKLDWIGVDDGTRSLSNAIPSQADFPTLVSKQAALAKNMKNDWALTNGKFAPNCNFQYTMGRNFRRKEKDVFGMIVSLTYTRTNALITTSRRSYTNNTDPNVPSQIDNDFLDKAFSAQTLAGAIANFSYKVSDNNTISFKNLYSINSDDRVIYRTGTNNPLDVNPNIMKSTARWFTQNNIYSGQLSGEHGIPKAKIKINWMGSYGDIKRVIPDLRRSIYSRYKNVTDPSDPVASDTMYAAQVAISNVGPDYGGGVFSATTKERIRNGRADISKLFSFGKKITDSSAAVVAANKKGLGNFFFGRKNTIEFKTGIYYQQRNRSFAARQLGLTKYNVVGGGVAFNDSLLYLPEDQIFNNANMGLMANGKGGFKLLDATKPTDSYIAQSNLVATYLMMDYRIRESFRLITGVRMERFTQKLDAKYDNGKPMNLLTTKTDFLPSVNAIFSLTDKQNIRACYSQTLNRPEFRELAPFAFYDFNTQFLYSGNAELKRALIHNYDLRYEFYPGRGQLLSLTAFDKEFINPIEQKSRSDVQGEISFANAPSARNTGGEIEFRVVLGALLKTDSCRLLNNLTFYSNFSYINSRVKLTNNTTAAIQYRQLQGQSPYVFNAGFMYQDVERGWSCSVAANRVGQRIFIVGNVNEPDIWENGRTVIDFQIGKTLMKKKLEIRLNVRDGLAQKLYFFQDRNGNKKLDTDKDDVLWISTFGRVITFNAAYKF